MTDIQDSTKDSALVTVIIPSYNHAQYIRCAIESVLSQTYEKIELIIVDDGSNDDSHTVIGEYSDHPKVTTILNFENNGQSFALNQALDASSGRYVAMLPSDDWFLPEKIALQVEKMEASATDVGVVYASGARYFEDTNETRNVELPVHTGWIAEKLIETGNFIYPVTPLYKRAVFDKVRPREGFKAEGEAIHMRIALYYRYEYVDEVVAVMRDHSYNIGKDAQVLYIEIENYLEWYFNLPELPDHIRSLKDIAFYRNNAVKAMQFIVDKRNFQMGRTCAIRAFRIFPKAMLSSKLVVAFLIALLPARLANGLLDLIKGKILAKRT